MLELHRHRRRARDWDEVCRPRDARAASRAAAPGTAAHRHQAYLRAESAAPGVPRSAPRSTAGRRRRAPLRWIEQPAGVYEIGHEGNGFAFDNEAPRHRVYLNAFRIADRLVTNGEYLEFMEAGGYENPALWLSQGWQTVREHGWQAPLYWENHDGAWWTMTLGRHGAGATRTSRSAT